MFKINFLDIKKILLLGGSYGQFPAIHEAKKRGYFIILCDYLTDNPGQYLADLYIPASTTDTDAILAIAIEHQIDAILGYASDPAALTAAIVGKKLGLPSNPPSSIDILTDKGKFRKLQQSAGLPVPAFYVFNPQETAPTWTPPLALPYIVKPVDASDTKGVFCIENQADFREVSLKSAFFSRKGELIAEAFIDAKTVNLHGDGFVVDGNIVFLGLGELIFTSPVAPLKPSATWYPGQLAPAYLEEAKNQIDTLIRMAGFQNGPVNIEARVNEKGDLYVMEIGPRSGGSMTPKIISYAYGFDMLKATFDLLEQKKVNIPDQKVRDVLGVTVHTNQNGYVRAIQPHPDLQPFLLESHVDVSIGDRVKSFEQANSSLGVYIYGFDEPSWLTTRREELYACITSQIVVDSLPEQAT